MVGVLLNGGPKAGDVWQMKLLMGRGILEQLNGENLSFYTASASPYCRAGLL